MMSPTAAKSISGGRVISFTTQPSDLKTAIASSIAFFTEGEAS